MFRPYVYYLYLYLIYINLMLFSPTKFCFKQMVGLFLLLQFVCLCLYAWSFITSNPIKYYSHFMSMLFPLGIHRYRSAVQLLPYGNLWMHLDALAFGRMDAIFYPLFVRECLPKIWNEHSSKKCIQYSILAVVARFCGKIHPKCFHEFS